MAFVDWFAAVATLIGGVGSAGAAIAAARGLNESKKYRMMGTRPIITFDRQGNISGQRIEPTGQSAALYTFTIRNDGLGPAVLGDDPLRADSPVDTYLKEGRTAGPFVTHVHPKQLPNVLPPGKTAQNVTLALGNLDRSPMSDPYIFEIRYLDVFGSQFWTSVFIDPLSGDVTRLEHGPKEDHTLWQRIAKAVNEVGT